MGFIDRSLLEGESLVYRARRHWLFDGVQHLKSAAIFCVFLGVLWLRPRALGWLQSLLSETIGAAASTTETTLRVVHLLFLAVALLIALYVVLNNAAYFSHEYGVTTRRVIFKTGFIRRRVVELSVRNIEAVQVTQGILGRILSFGTIQVSGTGKMVGVYPHIQSPIRFRDAMHGNHSVAA